MRSVYGPIDSWRLKRSLGVDLISQEGRVCTFNCVYCQIKRCQAVTSKRQKFVELEDLRGELIEALEIVGDHTDYLTFSGMGEPTLASNLREGVEMVNEVSNKPTAILTNSSLLHKNEVRNTLDRLDYVIASLDASDQEILKTINRPDENIHFKDIVEGLKGFSERFQGKFALEIMVIEENFSQILEISRLAQEMDIDEIQLNTPLRPSVVPPLNEKELQTTKDHFEDFETKIVYEEKRTETPNLDDKEVIKRGRPKK
ncbi:MAG: radical SAM protein [Candidatus Thermoplasmatota archaeon]